MKLQKQIGRSVSHRNRKLLSRRPSVESVEPGVLLASNSFVQGFVTNSSNVPIPNATVELETVSSSVVATTLTMADGYYGFNGVVPGEYHVVVAQNGYTTTGTTIQTTVNPASALPGNSGIDVTVEDLSSQLFNVTFSSGPLGLNHLDFTFLGTTYNGVQTGVLGLTLAGNAGNETSIDSVCTDLIDSVKSPNPNSGDATFQVQPGLEPSTASPSPSAENLGLIGYLYNKYANAPASSYDDAALQLCEWALIYNSMPTLNGNNFSVISEQFANTITDAQTYLADAIAANEPQDAYFLNLTPSDPKGDSQGMMSTDLLNFTEAPVGITTQASPSGNAVALGTSLSDTATLSGAYQTGGSIQFALEAPDGTTTDVGSPVPVTSGTTTYAAPTEPTATEVGTYTWQATYTGPGGNGLAVDSGANESMTTVVNTTSIATTASGTANDVVGSSLLSDQAVISNSYDITSGTITFTLTAPDNSTTVEAVSVVPGQTTYTTPTSVLATQVGTYTWSASYTGDGLNSGAVDNGANESVTTVKTTPSIATTASGTANDVVGSSLLSDQAVISNSYDITSGTITFTLTAPDNSTTVEAVSVVPGQTTYTTPTSVLATQVGTYTWSASYTGDGLNSGAVDNGANESVTTVKTTPSIATTASGTANDVVGSSLLSDQAVISNSYDITSGTITFTLTAPDNSTTVEAVSVVPGQTTYTTPTSVLATQVGTYTWSASYTGDGLNSGAVDNGSNESVTTVKTTPSIATTASGTANDVVGSSLLSDQAVISNSYDITSGTITFTLTAPDNSTTVEAVSVVPGQTTYTTPTSVLATQVGTYTWSASYTGDGLNGGAVDNGANESVTTVKTTPSIATTASGTANDVVGSSLLSDQAVISNSYDITSGTITFTLTAPDNSTTVEAVSVVPGQMTYTTPTSVLATQVGTYTWSASYTGDGLNSGAVDNGSNESVTTVKTTPSIATTASATANDVVGSSLLSDQAVISNSYDITSGTITFTLTAPDNSTTVEAVSVVPGQTTYTTPTSVLATQTGTYTWSASYTGDGLNSGAVDNGQNESVTITGTNISILTAPNVTVVTVGTSCGPLTDTATLSGGSNPTGSITFTLYSPTGTLLDTETVQVTHGDGSYTTPKGYTLPSSNPKLGAYQWDATYTGNDGTATDANNAWEQVQVVTPCCNLTGISYNVTTPPPNSSTTKVTSLSGNTAEGDKVTANFTVPAGYYDELTLVVYTAPESSYNLDDANQQVISSVVTGFFGPGAHSLGPVTIPCSFYQIDFVCGAPITTLGGAGGNSNTYHGQNRFIDSDNGGVNPVGSPELQVTGTVFSDVNDDGIQETGDTGLAGVTVTLSGTDAYGNSVSVSTQTNSSGAYTFAGLPFSNGSGYTVTPTVPSGYSAGIATAGNVDGASDGSSSSSPESVGGVVMANAGQTNGAGYNFGMIKPTSISGEVYKDLNGDGKLESGDTGLSGVTVKLYNSSGTQVGSTTTNSSGDYSFSNLAPGTYKVVETILNNYIGTGSDVGTVGGNTDGTSVNVSTIGSIALNSGQSGVSYNFGESQPVCISGKVYCDNQGNCNSSQSGLGGVTLKCYNSAGVCVGTTTTGSSGSNVGCYSFNNLAPGVYTVCSTTLSGYNGTGTNIGSNGGSSPNCSTINGITAGSGASCTNYDFGQKKGR